MDPAIFKAYDIRGFIPTKSMKKVHGRLAVPRPVFCVRCLAVMSGARLRPSRCVSVAI